MTTPTEYATAIKTTEQPQRDWLAMASIPLLESAVVSMFIVAGCTAAQFVGSDPVAVYQQSFVDAKRHNDRLAESVRLSRVEPPAVEVGMLDLYAPAAE